MTKHREVYAKHFSVGEQDFVPCERCSMPCDHIHHIKYRSRQGKDEIENLMALCAGCHTLAHSEIITEEEMQEIHNQFLENYERTRRASSVL